MVAQCGFEGSALSQHFCKRRITSMHLQISKREGNERVITTTHEHLRSFLTVRVDRTPTVSSKADVTIGPHINAYAEDF